MKILVVDEEKQCSYDLSELLRRVGYKCDNAYSYNEATAKLLAYNYNIVISNVNISEANGLNLVEFINLHPTKTEIILVSDKTDIVSSINAFEVGIYDFLTKPIDNKKLLNMVSEIKAKWNENIKYKIEDLNAIVNEKPDSAIINFDKVIIERNPLVTNKQLDEIGIFSEKLTNIYKKLQKLHAHPDIPVLIEGETGTGKEAIAKYLHFEGNFCDEPFFAVNCSTLKKDMFEAELFGYEKGSFTGADPNGKDGFLTLAGNGTLFLDEVTEIPLESQAKLLRVLQEKEFYKLGGTTLLKTNCRIVCATNIHIEELVSKRLFRDDLYFRLTISKIIIPPLRERKEEIIPLTLFLLQQLLKRFGIEINGIEVGALKILKEFRWFGNVRELKNYLMKLLIFNSVDVISTDLISIGENPSSETQEKTPINENSPIKDTKAIDFVKDFQLPDVPFDLNNHIMNIIELTLEKFNGNKSQSAKFLNLKREQMYNRYKTDKN